MAASGSVVAGSIHLPKNTTSLLVLQDGETALGLGNTGQASYIASVRKSLLSMLYGIQVSRGTVSLDDTLADLGIDDNAGLLPVEKTARVRDLLTSRSAVYHPPSSPGSDESSFPPRGTKRPGEHFVYNNWDFNAAGEILEKLTGTSVFTTFAKHLAEPLGFQDYNPARQRKLGNPRRSRYLAHHFFLSARDLGQIGLLIAAGGRWEDRQLVPHEWLAESLTPQVHRSDMPAATGFGNCDYGYLWWLPREKGPEWDSAVLAAGNFGQYLLILPAISAVIVHRRHVSDNFAIARNNLGSTTGLAPEPVTHEEFMDLARALTARVLHS